MGSRRHWDVLGASAAVLTTWPLAVIGAAQILLDDGRPVIYRQRRLGMHGQPFDILKFRTMRTAASGPPLTSADDPRVTRPGRWLRATKLDEWPQLINVLRGEMSLVGPRPEVPALAAFWTPQDRDVVLGVRPGITDLATWVYRDETALMPTSDQDPVEHYTLRIMPAKLALNIRYLSSRSLPLDGVVLLGTLLSLAGVRPVADRLQQYVIHRVGADVGSATSPL